MAGADRPGDVVGDEDDDDDDSFPSLTAGTSEVRR